MIKRNGISVIIPVWNGATTIKKAINSCLAQTLLPREILVCDDGSTDKTRIIVKSMHSPLVRWIGAKKHSGKPAVPRNRGLKKAKGEWLAFLDADDAWLPNKLKEQIAAAKKTNCLAVCSNAYRKIKGDIRRTLYFNFPEKRLTLGNLLITNFVICSSMLLHYSLLKKTGYFLQDNEAKGGEDYILWLRVATQTNIAYLKKPSVIYNDQPETSARSKVNKNPLLLKMQVLKNFLCWILKV